MKLYLAQLNPTVGDMDGNLDRVLKAYGEGVVAGADLVVCPEMALVGYPPKDLIDRREIVDALEGALARLAAQTGPTGLIVGTVRPNPSGQGRPLVNAAVLLADSRVLGTWPKTLLPAYDVFDEERYFESSPECRAATFRRWRLGITVCEDIWNVATEQGYRRYRRDPVAELAPQKPDVIINISASPFELGKLSTRLALLSHVARTHHLPIVYVNQVGGNDELIFDGRSLVVDAQGRVTAWATAFQECSLLADLAAPPCAPIPELSQEEELAEALCLGTRDYLRKCGFRKVLVGLSGGVDSSIVACLAARALGPENVWGISMPSRFNISASLEDARTLAERLGIRFDVLPIQDVFEQYLKTFQPVFRDLPSNVAEENTQARIRGTLLMALSNKFGHLVLTTGNKSEVAVGYCTLYGDMCGALAVISDISKGMVYRLAHWFNRDREIIPRRVIERAPSAELRPNQTDQDTLPPYDELDAVLQAFVEEGRTAAELVRTGHRPDIVKQVIRMINSNEFKRYQAAPGLKVTTKAFGFGRRWPLAKSSKFFLPE